jgi:hypothetical protein
LAHIKTGKRVEARLTQEAVDNGKQFRALSSESRNYTPGSPEHLVYQEKRDAILDWFRTTPDADIVTVRILE